MKKFGLGFGFRKFGFGKKVSVSVSKKIGLGKKSRYRFRKKLVLEQSLGFGFGKFGLGKEKIQITRTLLVMIDVWLILCQHLPFIELVLLTAKEYLREDENMQKALCEPEEDNSKNVQLSRKERFIIFLNLIGKFGFP